MSRRDQRSAKAAAYRHLYNTRAWKDLRASQLMREPLCERCKAQGRITAASVAHHKEPHRGDREKFFRGALASSCKPCHDVHEQRIEARGFEHGVDVDGRPVDAAHPWNL